MLSNKHECHENQCTNSHTLLKGISEFLPVISIFFWPIWDIFNIDNLHVIVISKYGFLENRYSESHTC